MHLHNIWVEKIPLFLLNKYVFHDFWKLPVIVLHIDYTCSVSSSISMTWSLRCVMTTYCLYLRNRSAPAVNCWVIIHCLKVSCKEDQVTSAQWEWFIFIQLTNKQWIITLIIHALELIYFDSNTQLTRKTHWKSSAYSHFLPLHWRTPGNT